MKNKLYYLIAIHVNVPRGTHRRHIIDLESPGRARS